MPVTPPAQPAAIGQLAAETTYSLAQVNTLLGSSDWRAIAGQEKGS